MLGVLIGVALSALLIGAYVGVMYGQALKTSPQEVYAVGKVVSIDKTSWTVEAAFYVLAVNEQTIKSGNLVIIHFVGHDAISKWLAYQINVNDWLYVEGSYVESHSWTVNDDQWHYAFGCPTGISADTNIAATGFATASDTWPNTQFDAQSIIDGNLKTRWSSSTNGVWPKWVMIDLGKPLPIVNGLIVWQAAYATSYEVQYSSDAISWATAIKTGARSQGDAPFTLTEPVTARYWRIYVPSGIGNPHANISVYEFQLYVNCPWLSENF